MTRVLATTCRAALLAMLAVPGRAAADAPEPDGNRLRLDLAALGGSAQPDADLADYQWDVTPRGAWGAQAMVARRRWAAGLRMWRTRTTQSVGDAAPVVTATTWDAVGRGTFGTMAGVRMFAAASAGRVHFGYRPERIEVTAGGVPVTVDLAAMDEWTAGVGLGMERVLSGRWSASVEIDRSVFGLDTAHRAGDTIEQSRERFGEWSARFGLAGSFGLR